MNVGVLAVSEVSGESIVRLEGVRRSFGDVVAVDGVDLEVARGEFLSFLGPSGCGKTTLLRIIAGFESADEGSVVVAGREVGNLPPERRPLNMVFQRYALFPHLNVADNIAFGLRLEKRSKPKIRSRVAELLQLVQLEGLDARYPSQISGGQAQRVALARALARGPEVLLLDEPLAALDRAVRRDLQDQLKSIQREVGTTFVYVTHDQEEAMSMSSRIALMDAGRITQLAEPSELYRRPSSTFAASFVGDANILDCETFLTADGGQMLRWRGLEIDAGHLGLSPDSPAARIMVRPEDLIVAPAALDGSSPQATVTQSTFHGFYWLHSIDVEGAQLVSREMSENPTVKVGQPVSVMVGERRGTLLPD